jgi:hypothetical protein
VELGLDEVDESCGRGLLLGVQRAVERLASLPKNTEKRSELTR